MNILFLSQVAMDKKNSFGNTVCNWFEGNVWKNDEFFHFYTRNQNPDNDMNIDYYKLTDIDVVNGVMKMKIQGKEFSSDEVKINKKDNETEKKELEQINKIQNAKKNQMIYFAHEQIWKSQLWLNKYFKSFITKAKPDILFAFAIDQYILWPLIKYLKKNTNCKVVLFISDDVYGAINNKSWYRKCYLIKEFEECIEYSDKLYAVSEEMCELYEQRFNKPVEVLYKGCDLSTEPKGFLNEPIKIVYAGNGPELDNLTNLVKESKLEKNVEFLGYTLDLDKYFNVSECLVACSIREGLGLNVIEAMMCGNPIVASINRGHNELVNDGENGYLVEATNSKMFAKKIIKVLDEPKCYKYNSLNKARVYADKNVYKELKKYINLKVLLIQKAIRNYILYYHNYIKFKIIL